MCLHYKIIESPLYVFSGQRYQNVQMLYEGRYSAVYIKVRL